MDAKQFGSFLAKQRKEKGYTQKELAEHLGVTDKAISRWENGHGYPDIESLEPLAKELGVSLMELLHGEFHGGQALDASEEGAKTADQSASEADEAITNALEITMENRQKERKRTLILYAVTLLFFVLFSILKKIPLVGTIAMGIAVLYGVSGLALTLQGRGQNENATSLRRTNVFFGVLLLMVALGILFLLLGTSIQVATS